MLVEDIMTQELEAIDKDQKLSDAIEKMGKKRISRLVVMDNGNVKGVITEKDILKVLGSKKHGKALPSSLHVSTAASKGIISIEKGKKIGEAAKIMMDNNIRSLLVTDGDPVGLVTSTDMLKPLFHSTDPLGDVMTDRYKSVNPTDRVVHARRIMLDNDLNWVLVKDGPNVVGLITERELGKALSNFRKAADNLQYNRIRNMIVEDVMTQDVKTLDLNDTVGNAAKMMFENRFSGMPVFKDHKIQGVVNKSDLIDLLV